MRRASVFTGIFVLFAILIVNFNVVYARVGPLSIPGLDIGENDTISEADKEYRIIAIDGDLIKLGKTEMKVDTRIISFPENFPPEIDKNEVVQALVYDKQEEFVIFGKYSLVDFLPLILMIKVEQEEAMVITYNHQNNKISMNINHDLRQKEREVGIKFSFFVAFFLFLSALMSSIIFGLRGLHFPLALSIAVTGEVVYGAALKEAGATLNSAASALVIVVLALFAAMFAFNFARVNHPRSFFKNVLGINMITFIFASIVAITAQTAFSVESIILFKLFFPYATVCVFTYLFLYFFIDKE